MEYWIESQERYCDTELQKIFLILANLFPIFWIFHVAIVNYKIFRHLLYQTFQSKRTKKLPITQNKKSWPSIVYCEYIYLYNSRSISYTKSYDNIWALDELECWQYLHISWIACLTSYCADRPKTWWALWGSAYSIVQSHSLRDTIW